MIKPRTRSQRIALSSIFYAVVFGVTTWIGIYGAEHAKEILGVWQFGRGYFGRPFAGHAVFFYIVLALLILGTWHFQKAADEAHRGEEARRVDAEQQLIGATGKLMTQAGELQELVRTVPPATALNTFNEVDAQGRTVWNDTWKRVFGPTPIAVDEIDSAIRTVLRGVAKLVSVFDKRENAITYYANVAVFIPQDELGKMPVERRRTIADKMLGANKDLSPDLRGVLHVTRSLSTTTGSSVDDDEDEELTELVFPVPKPPDEHDDKGQSHVLPGAPLAFCHKRHYTYTDQDALMKWCDTKGSFAPGTAGILKQYFAGEGGKAVQGFISIPILPYSGREAKKEPIGVVNVHCNQAGFLTDRKEQFLTPLLYPLLAPLYDLLDLRQNTLATLAARDRPLQSGAPGN